VRVFTQVISFVGRVKEVCMDESKTYSGIGGWLLLVGFGIIMSPIRLLTSVFPIYSELFSSDLWEILTSPESMHYHELWKPILIGEFAINSLLFIAWILIAYLFFLKKKIFPKCFLGIWIFLTVFIIVDAVLIGSLLPDEPIFDFDTIKELTRSLIVVLVWFPYMIRSKRVKATFVK